MTATSSAQTADAAETAGASQETVLLATSGGEASNSSSSAFSSISSLWDEDQRRVTQFVLDARSELCGSVRRRKVNHCNQGRHASNALMTLSHTLAQWSDSLIVQLLHCGEFDEPAAQLPLDDFPCLRLFGRAPQRPPLSAPRTPPLPASSLEFPRVGGHAPIRSHAIRLPTR